MLRFESPWMFALLALLPLLLWWQRRRGGRPFLRFSSTEAAARATHTPRIAMLHLPTVLRYLALLLFIGALARPQMGFERVRDFSRGIAIEMVVDRSSSMGAEMRYLGLRSNRLEVVKKVFTDFVDGAGDLPGRPNDLVGMITFARFPDTVCPMTLSHATLRTLIESVKLVQDRDEDGTAIGDAVALAAARLRTAEETLKRKSGGTADYEIKSKIIIVLTDGENNAGERSVADAAELAQQWGVKVYVIGVGDDRALTTAFGVVNVPKRPGVDDAALRELAEQTGGIYRLATDSQSLIDVYKEIDELEKSEIEAVRYLDYRELFSPFALAGLCLIGLEALLRATFLRTIP
ncbi:MAG: VWA domain-containing protein [Acidobacteria bacterium]|nr:VWA domain-containing protein [Acidobacteriota bacterium]